MSFKILYRTIAIVSTIIFSTTAYAQIADSIDFMKEFDEHSFRDAQLASTVKDSTKLSEHLIGIKYGGSINSVSFSQSFDTKSLISYKNFGIYYTYYHSLWNSISLFGIEAGVQYNESGYTSLRYTEPESVPDRVAIEGKERFEEITIPFVSQFRIDFWRMRLLANAGGFGSYKLKTTFSGNVADTITSTYKTGGYGFILGGGIAYIFRPFEIHIEANYWYNFSNLYDNKAYYEGVWVSSHTSQIIITAGLFCRLGGSSYKDPANSPRKRKNSSVIEIDFGK